MKTLKMIIFTILFSITSTALSQKKTSSVQVDQLTSHTNEVSILIKGPAAETIMNSLDKKNTDVQSLNGVVYKKNLAPHVSCYKNTSFSTKGTELVNQYCIIQLNKGVAVIN